MQEHHCGKQLLFFAKAGPVFYCAENCHYLMVRRGICTWSYSICVEKGGISNGILHLQKFLLRKHLVFWKILSSCIVWCTEEAGKLNFKRALEGNKPLLSETTKCS